MKLEHLKNDLFGEIAVCEKNSLAAIVGGAEVGAGTKTKGGVTETGIAYCWDCTTGTGDDASTTLCQDGEWSLDDCKCDVAFAGAVQEGGFEVVEAPSSVSPSRYFSF
jgi:hypothetical protein